MDSNLSAVKLEAAALSTVPQSVQLFDTDEMVSFGFY